MTTTAKLPERIDPVKAEVLGDYYRGMGLVGRLTTEAAKDTGTDYEVYYRIYLNRSHLMTAGLNPSTWTDEERAEFITAAI